MFEKILQADEKIELQEEGIYCGDGAVASVKQGYVILTNKRFVICKKAVTALVITLTIIIFATIYFGIFVTTGLVSGAIPSAIIAVVSFGLGTAISNFLNKGKKKALDKAEFSFNRNDIKSVEDGKRGIHKMLVIKTKNGDVCKIKVEDKENWRTSLMKTGHIS